MVTPFFFSPSQSGQVSAVDAELAPPCLSLLRRYVPGLPVEFVQY